MNEKTKKWIEKAQKIHGDKYNYSKTNYIHSEQKVIIICSEHGKFEQRPCDHLKKSGCKKCGILTNKKNKTKSNEQFIIESKIVHGNKYDYSKVNYKHSFEKVIIICPEHGEFEQQPSVHIKGSGCNKCGIIQQTNKIKLNNNIFFEKANKIHENKYNYSKVDYIHSEQKIIIICNKHGEFEQKPYQHIQGRGCPKCQNLKTNDEFILDAIKVHKYKYNYSKVDYNHSFEKVIIICSEHGEFEQKPVIHLQGSGCPSCSFEKIISKAELEIIDFLKEIEIKNISTSNRTILNNQELDIYLPDHKLAIEFNGLYWHSELKKHDNYHIEKTKECNSLDIQLIHIFEDEWLFKKDIVKSRLMNLLKKNNNKIYARQTIAKEIDNKQYKSFIENNHLQGYVAGKIYLGLFYKSNSSEKEYLVSVMSFGSLRKNLGNVSKENYYELLRFANIKKVNVIGGASKLLKYFEKQYSPEYIISYADKRWSLGNLYKQLKFGLSHESKPNYFYVDGLQRLNRFNFRKNILIEKYGCSPEITEREFMKNVMNYPRIYDCGNYVFEKQY